MDITERMSLAMIRGLHSSLQILSKFSFCYDFNSFYSVNSRSYDFLDMTTSLNHTSGLFTAPATKDYLVTLTAQIFPIDEPSHLENYAQLFVLKNGKLASLDHYLVIGEHQLGDLRQKIKLQKGETLEVFVGHHNHMGYTFMSNGEIERKAGFFLQNVRFCIF